MNRVHAEYRGLDQRCCSQTAGLAYHAVLLAAKGDLDGPTETAQQVRVAATTIKSTRLMNASMSLLCASPPPRRSRRRGLSRQRRSALPPNAAQTRHAV